MAQRWGICPQALHVGHLNSFLELGEGNLTTKNRKVQMPRRGNDLKLQIDPCIMFGAGHVRTPKYQVSFGQKFIS